MSTQPSPKRQLFVVICYFLAAIGLGMLGAYVFDDKPRLADLTYLIATVLVGFGFSRLP